MLFLGHNNTQRRQLRVIRFHLAVAVAAAAAATFLLFSISLLAIRRGARCANRMQHSNEIKYGNRAEETTDKPKKNMRNDAMLYAAAESRRE